MILSCNSCEKKFVVPDQAITATGRTVQCGSCGNKWKQFPIKIEISKNTSINEISAKKISSLSKKTKPKKSKIKKNLYTTEYLKKKHGLIIKNSENKANKSLTNTSKSKSSVGFYGYIIILFVFLITLYGVLNLTEEIIILNFPNSEMYINYLHEVIDILRISFSEIYRSAF